MIDIVFVSFRRGLFPPLGLELTIFRRGRKDFFFLAVRDVEERFIGVKGEQRVLQCVKKKNKLCLLEGAIYVSIRAFVVSFLDSENNK